MSQADRKFWKALLTSAALMTVLTVTMVTAAFAQVPIYTRPSFVSSGGGTITGPLSVADGACAANAYGLAFASDIGTTGWYRSSAGQWTLCSSTAGHFSLITGGTLRMSSAGGISVTSSTSTATADVFLLRDAAGIWASRDGTNAQALRIYNTYANGGTDVERLDIGFAGNVATVGTSAAGTGTVRELRLAGQGIRFYHTGVGGTNSWQINTSGHLLAVTDNTYDIGASGATRPRNVFVAGVLTTGTQIAGGAATTLTESTPTTFLTITVPSSGGCAGRVDYTVFAADATNTQIKSGQLFYSAVANSSGTVTAATIADSDTLNPVTSGTLTNTMTSATAANSHTLLANAVSSLTQTTLQIRYRVMQFGGTCTIVGS